MKEKIKPLVDQVINNNWSNSCQLIDELMDHVWTYSRLKTIIDSHYSFLMGFLAEDKTTDSMNVGKVIHAIIQKDFSVKFAVKQLSGNSKAARKETEDIKASGSILLTKTQGELIENVIKSAINNQEVKAIQDAAIGIEAWHEKEVNGVKVGGYIDIETKDHAVEIKTINNASKESIERTFADLCYTMQAYIYRLITGKPVKYIIIETSHPYRTIVIEPSEDYYLHGKLKFEQAMDELTALCENISQEEINNYSTSKNLVKLGLSSWESRKLQHWKDENK